ncbi:hypothetical protein JB92DRAFT_2822703 [Gautieria morchelliformis]|nr:hypothetical protein JB92DRAFT_2822703 [Gautieria morchelliformis]
MCVVDLVSKRSHFIPNMTTITALGAVEEEGQGLVGPCGSIGRQVDRKQVSELSTPGVRSQC